MGQPLPGQGKMVALAGQGPTLWAVGRVAGGMAGLTTTRPVKLEASDRLVLFALEKGQWLARAELPGEIEADKVERMDLVVVGDGASVRVLATCLRASGGVDLVQTELPHGKWRHRVLLASGGVIQQHKLMADGVTPIIWMAKATGPGFLWPTDWPQDRVVALQLPDGRNATSERAVATAGGRVSLLFTDKDKLYEQQYKASGSPLGEAGEISTPTDSHQGEGDNWMQLGVMLLLTFVLFNSLRRRGQIQETMRFVEALNLAPLRRRFLAGLVDLTPVFVVSIILGVRFRGVADPMTLLNEPTWVWCNLAANALYILHTMAGELLFGRSLGKWMFGLRVVSLTGERAGGGAIVVRNVLRIIDLMAVFVTLTLIPYSPLRQRIGDLAAGTLVVRDQAAAETTGGEEGGEETGNGE